MVNFFQRLAGICLVSASLLPLTSRGQCNLIPNGDFEQQTSTATFTQSGNLYPGPNDDLALWRTAAGTPDYFSTNAAPYSYLDPTGKFTPHSGNASIGLYAAADGGSSSNYGPLEYATLRNSLNLQKGLYYASFYALAANPAAGARSLGMNVTPNTSSNAPTNGLVPLHNVFDYYVAAANGIQNQSIISGTTWTQVNGTFTLNNPGYYDINLGNFHPSTYYPQNNSDGIFYYLDDVILARVPEAGEDIFVCPNRKLTLGTQSAFCPGPGLPGFTYQWYQLDNSGNFTILSGATFSTLLIRVSTTTTYKLVVTIPTSPVQTYETQVTVNVLPAPVAPQLSTLNDDQCLKAIKYNIDNYDSGLTYTVTNITGALDAPQPNPVGQVFTINGTGGINGSSTGGSFTLTASNACGSASTSTTVTFGPPTAPAGPSFIPTGLPVACYDASQSFYLLNYDPNLVYTITGVEPGINAIPHVMGYQTHIWYGGPASPYIPSPGPTFSIKGSGNPYGGHFTITATNRCGLTSQLIIPDDYQDAQWTITCRTAAPAQPYTLSPNPATDEVLIQTTSEPSEKEMTMQDVISAVRVVDSYGVTRLEQQGEGTNALRLRTSQLSAGLYMVQILRGETVVSTQRLQIDK